jgi:LysR family pca operon transcriptional activator
LPVTANRYLARKLRMQHMRLIEALDRAGSLSEAARLLGVSQPAASKGLQDVEALIGQRLFERVASGVRSTPAGEILIRWARRMLADMGRLDEELDRLEAPGGGLVAIGALPVAAAGLASPIIRALAADELDLEIRLEEARLEMLLPRLVSGEIEVIIGRLYEPELPDGLMRIPLYDEPIALVARADHPIFDLSAGSPDLSAYTLLLPTFSQRLGREIEHFLARADVPLPTKRIRSTSHMAIREMLQETDMVTVTPQLLVAGDLRRGSLRVLAISAQGPVRPAGILLNPARPATPNTTLVLQAIRLCVSEQLGKPGSGTARLP